MKLQVALEYMIVFAFVMLLFTLIFITVAKQRASVLNQQLDSHLQLVAEYIASQMNIAQQAGNGYNATTQIPSSGSISAYSLNVTKNGEIIVSATLGSEVVSAVAFSLSGSVTSNSAWLSSNTNTYAVPVTNGTLALQNVYGTICVDYMCPNATNQAGSISLSSQVVHAATFFPENGLSSQASISIPVTTNTIPLSATNSLSISLWIYVRNFTTSSAAHPINKGTLGSGTDNYAFYLFGNNLGNNQQGIVQLYGDAGGSWNAISPPYTIPANGLNSWYNLIFTYSSTAGGVLYVNGNAIGHSSNAGSLVQNTNNVLITNDAQNGAFSLANIQIYNTTLASGSAEALYLGGITASPTVGAGLLGWFPLNGNSKDYSGNGNNGNAVGYVPYQTVAQLYATVRGKGGALLANTLVGFETTEGNFSGGAYGYANYTNSSGVARALLTQQGNNGYADVKAVAYSGSSSSQNALVGWWPLNLGQGIYSPDISGYNYLGIATNNVSWSMPAFLTGFDGRDSYVYSSGSASYKPATLSAWIYDTQPAISMQPQIADDIIDIGGASLSLQGGKACISFNGINAGFPSNSECSATQVSNNAWYFVAGTYGSSTETVYVNGGIANTLGISGTLSGATTNAISIGACEYCGAPGNFFSGYITDAQAYTNALTTGEISSLYQEGISAPPFPFQSNIGWWPLSGDAIDYSGNKNNASSVNTYAIPFNISGVTNRSVGTLQYGSFNGASSSINIGNSLTLQPLSAISIVAWINASAAQAGKPQIASDNGSAGQQGYNFSLKNGDLNFIVRGIATSWGSCSVTGGTSILDGRKHFVSAVYNTSGIAVYLDGSLQASSACTNTAVNYSTPSTGLIGKGFNGIISNVQIYSTALSQRNITSLYLNGPTAFPISLGGLIGWYPLDGDTNDYSLYADNGTASSISYVVPNGILQTVLPSIGGYGQGFNTQNSHVLASNSPILQTSYTISFWMNRNLYQSGCNSVIGKSGTANVLIYSKSANGCSGGSTQNQPLIFKYTDSAGTAHDGYQSGSVPSAEWVYAAVTFNSGTLTWYINGQQSNQYTSLANPSANSKALYIGAGDSNFNGSIANVQLFSTALNASQIFQLYKGQMPPSASAYIPMSWLP